MMKNEQIIDYRVAIQLNEPLYTRPLRIVVWDSLAVIRTSAVYLILCWLSVHSFSLRGLTALCNRRNEDCNML